MSFLPRRAVLKFAVPAAVFARATEPNPPVWPDSVYVFGPETATATIQDAVQNAYATNGGPEENGQFSSERYAFLFKAGSYDVDVPVGYYTTVAGLGQKPTDVVFTGANGVYCQEANFDYEVGALDTFWRSAENFQTDAAMLWAASQASPLRSIVVTKDLSLAQYAGGCCEGYSSGGFLANSLVQGAVNFGSQQQFFTRSSTIGSTTSGVWNMVFVGTEGAPTSHCGRGDDGELPFVVVDEAPAVAEKPFITVDENDTWALNVPPVHFYTRGSSMGSSDAVIHSFESVYVARADVDTASSINAKLAEGLHVVLAAGIFNLDAPLEVNNPNTVILGLGMATLVSSNGNAVISVADVPGVRIAGLLLNAGPLPTKSLLEWGTVSYAGDALNPGMLHDVFARVGGPAVPAAQQVEVMIRINAGNVIGDNLWLWRADHYDGGETTGGQWPCNNALVVNGDDVTMYGLAAEHTLTDIVVWNGERGSTFFFQAEFPYDVTEEYGTNGYAGYRVASDVTTHVAHGVGVYHFFRDFPVTVQSGIRTPAALVSSVISPLSVFLNGQGTTLHVINDLGNATTPAAGGGSPTWYCGDSTSSASVMVV